MPRSLFTRVSIFHFNFLMLRHGWAVEQRVYWSTAGGKDIHVEYQNNFMLYIATYQVCCSFSIGIQYHFIVCNSTD